MISHLLGGFHVAWKPPKSSDHGLQYTRFSFVFLVKATTAFKKNTLTCPWLCPWYALAGLGGPGFCLLQLPCNFLCVYIVYLQIQACVSWPKSAGQSCSQAYTNYILRPAGGKSLLSFLPPCTLTCFDFNVTGFCIILWVLAM